MAVSVNKERPTCREEIHVPVTYDLSEDTGQDSLVTDEDVTGLYPADAVAAASTVTWPTGDGLAKLDD